MIHDMRIRIQYNVSNMKNLNIKMRMSICVNINASRLHVFISYSLNAEIHVYIYISLYLGFCLNGWYSVSVLFKVSTAGGRLDGFRIRFPWTPAVSGRDLPYGLPYDLSRIVSVEWCLPSGLFQRVSPEYSPEGPLPYILYCDL